MKCIYCGNTESKVLDSRSSDDTNSIRRRRECLSCGKRFTTYETVETTPLLVIKSDNSRQEFDAEKLKRGIIRACEKRPVSMAQIDMIVSNIEKVLYNSLDQEVESSKIGELVMDNLKKVDEVSYIRFASVYRKFADLTHFIEFIQEYDTQK
ncbi:MAG: transcriptional regulator NrdR [Firmicutes bacterium]|nr:transcriptional regulator NrdR [Bacillota bacterium]MDY5676596.1 transcriptional regulator NrdR [Eubacteriales bacterium]